MKINDIKFYQKTYSGTLYACSHVWTLNLLPAIKYKALHIFSRLQIFGQWHEHKKKVLNLKYRTDNVKPVYIYTWKNKNYFRILQYHTSQTQKPYHTTCLSDPKVKYKQCFRCINWNTVIHSIQQKSILNSLSQFQTVTIQCDSINSAYLSAFGSPVLLTRVSYVCDTRLANPIIYLGSFVTVNCTENNKFSISNKEFNNL